MKAQTPVETEVCSILLPLHVPSKALGFVGFHTWKRKHCCKSGPLMFHGFHREVSYSSTPTHRLETAVKLHHRGGELAGSFWRNRSRGGTRFPGPVVGCRWVEGSLAKREDSEFGWVVDVRKDPVIAVEMVEGGFDNGCDPVKIPRLMRWFSDSTRYFRCWKHGLIDLLSMGHYRAQNSSSMGKMNPQSLYVLPCHLNLYSP